MSDPIIQLTGIHAAYRHGRQRVTALDGVDLTVEHGEIFGLLGPNGAGKTTLLSILEGLLRPDRGRVTLDGIDVLAAPAEAKRRLGIQLQRSALIDDLTVAELVHLYSSLYEVEMSKAQVDELLARFDLADKVRSFARRLSGGQQQRLALALAVANDPPIVLLDEPTSALDPRARRAMWDIIRRLHTEGRTILLTTHAMEEAEALCSRVAIIDRGQIVACDTPAALIDQIDVRPILKAVIEVPLDRVAPLPGVRAARYTGQHLEVETAEPQVTLAALHQLAAEHGRRVGDVAIRPPNLEDVFLKLTGRSLG
ncbi:ABC transporter ATP-binding protein [Promineifilum sp.]|uniref:ABC transporter ATP-binding protein n=1 Tax=Promineifilum sp. TaxID=2664178 RepID=UPI0035B282EF